MVPSAATLFLSFSFLKTIMGLLASHQAAKTKEGMNLTLELAGLEHTSLEGKVTLRHSDFI